MREMCNAKIVHYCINRVVHTLSTGYQPVGHWLSTGCPQAITLSHSLGYRLTETSLGTVSACACHTYLLKLGYYYSLRFYTILYFFKLYCVILASRASYADCRKTHDSTQSHSEELRPRSSDRRIRMQPLALLVS